EHAPGQAREPAGMAGGIAALAAGKLYALQPPYALDGRVSSYPASARGYSVANSYLLTQSDAAMLIDTGFGKDEPLIRAQIESLIAPGLPLYCFRCGSTSSCRSTTSKPSPDTSTSRPSPDTSTSRPATPVMSTRHCGSISAPRRTAAACSNR